MHTSNCNCPTCRQARATAFELETFDDEFGAFGDSELELPLSEAEEVELAMELLSVTSEAEMDQFLGKVFKKVWRGIKKVGSFVGKVARPLGRALKAVAKKALPFVGGALGSLIPIPGVGTAVGSAVGRALGKALELETAGMNVEEREFEMARRFVRIAAAAAQRAANAPDGIEAEVVVRKVVRDAMRRPIAAGPGPSAASSGRWLRRGRNIVVYAA